MSRAPNDPAAGEPGAGTALAAARWTPARPVTASAVTEAPGYAERAQRAEPPGRVLCALHRGLLTFDREQPEKTRTQRWKSCSGPRGRRTRQLGPVR